MELRDLPSVDELARGVDDPLAVDAARAVLDAGARGDPRRAPSRATSRARLRDELARRAAPEAAARAQRDRRDRAHEPRAGAARRGRRSTRVREAARGYSNLEYDLARRRARLAAGSRRRRSCAG